MMRQFFQGVPAELSEAAEVDGSGVFKTFFRIILPLSTSMMLTVFLFSFAWSWTDDFYSSLFFTDFNLLNKIVHVSRGLFGSQSMSVSIRLNTAALLIVVPLLIVYIIAQKRFVQGIESSGIVG